MDRNSNITVAITGANSYIGTHLVPRARARGWGVRVLARRPTPEMGAENFFFDFEKGCRPEALQGVDVLIHLAWARPDRPRWRRRRNINAEGTKKLLETARACGVRKIIFISSQLSNPNALSFYGREKYEVEKLFDGSGESVLRIGFVFGGRAQGIYKQTLETLRKATVIPIIRKNAPLNPIHIDDLVEKILKRADFEQAPAPKTASLGTPTPIAFSDFLKILARTEFRREIHPVALPRYLVTLPVWLLSWISARGMDLSERLGGILSAHPMPSQENLQQTETCIRKGFRRRLLKEGLAFSQYLFGKKDRRLARNYCRRLELRPYSKPLPLSEWILYFPRLLFLMEPLPFLKKNPRMREVQKRLRLTAELGEQSFSQKPALIHIFLVVIKEILFFPFRLLTHLCFLNAGRGYE